MSNVVEASKDFIIEQLKRENEELRRQIKAFQMPSPEELLCLEQIQYLRDRSAQREMALDDVKKLDLLIKNLRLVREQSKDSSSAPKFRDVTESDLVAIAQSQPEDIP